MRRLLSTMIKCNQDLPKNSLVVDMTLEKAAQLYENQVLTDTQRFRKIRLSESGLTLEVRFLKKQPVQWLSESTNSNQLEEKANKFLANDDQTINISQAALAQFLEDTGDQNPIHREAPYVLPGAFLLEQVSDRLAIDYRRLHLRFYAPAVLDSPIQLMVKGRAIGLFQAGKLVAKGDYDHDGYLYCCRP
ncbi:hypothetical protein [Streptococcus dysgalactiae]|uniref:Uncharacterized protein n=1 Tax=Streptococcus dysgalactiae subsp. dysgalactiae TaxID=99822 RepID=A0A9X7RXC0_STRDY|nr:hypothetical protein [Streptococcus dysgalactiae]MSU86475.1 hypothetical protein [Streptococcus dysgalactiae subsp. dysgalactiae]QGG97534.1 hypothetical protein EA459_02030 [Streptococcus dysgalactiae subsp. dysgalactiae]QGH01657.1 hypothetical protein EA457_03390 [Streptococcus dysgalactiae subsp. dysgalactiae]